MTAFIKFSLPAAILFAAIASGSAAAETTVDRLFREASDHYRAKEWKLASVALDALTSLQSNDQRTTDALFFLAESQVELGEYSKAFRTYQRYLAKQPSHETQVHRSMYRLGECAFLARQDTIAMEAFGSFEQKYPDDDLLGNIAAFRAEVVSRKGDHAAAMIMFRQALRDYPGGSMAENCRFGLARCCDIVGEVAEARAAYRDLIEDANPDQASRAALYLGLMEYNRGNFEAAESTFTEMLEEIEVRPFPMETRYWRGMSRFARKNFIGAEQDLRAAIDGKPDHPLMHSAHRYLAESLIGQSKFEEAIQVIDGYAEKSPTSIDFGPIRMTKVAALGLTGDWEAAKAEFDMSRFLIEDDKKRADFILRLARTAARSEELVFARGLYQSLDSEEYSGGTRRTAEYELSLLAPFDSADDLSLAVVDALNGPDSSNSGTAEPAQLPASVAANATPTRQLPAAMFASLEEARKHSDAGNPAEAISTLTAAIKAVEGDYADAAWYELGWCYWTTGQNKEEANCWETIHRDFEEGPYWDDATLRLAERMSETGQPQRAVELVGLLAEKYPAGAIPSAVAHGLHLQGQIAASNGKWDEVITPMRRIVDDYQPNDKKSEGEKNTDNDNLKITAQYWVAESLYRMERLDEAKQELLSLSHKLPRQPIDWLGMVPLRLAQLEARAGNWQTALDQAGKIARRFPRFNQQYEADYLMGRSLAALGRLDEGRLAYQRVSSSALAAGKETAAMAQWMIGETLLHQKQYEQAAREFLKVDVLHNHPRWQAAGLLLAGQCYEQLGRRSDAKSTYVDLVGRFPQTRFKMAASARLVQLKAAQPVLAEESLAPVVVSDRAVQTERSSVARKNSTAVDR